MCPPRAAQNGADNRHQQLGHQQLGHQRLAGGGGVAIATQLEHDDDVAEVAQPADGATVLSAAGFFIIM